MGPVAFKEVPVCDTVPYLAQRQTKAIGKVWVWAIGGGE
jgi:hypothetical protein